MRKYIYTNSSTLISTANDNFTEFKTIKSTYLSIDWSWIIEEDGVLIANNTTKNVKAGNIVISLYGRNNKPGELIIIDNPEWYTACIEQIEKEKECDNACVKEASTNVTCNNCCGKCMASVPSVDDCTEIESVTTECTEISE